MLSFSNVQELLDCLGIDTRRKMEIMKQVDYFTRVEAEKRDRMILEYFGREGVDKIVEKVSAKIFALNKKKLNILDVGAGTGFFTCKIFEKLSYLKVSLHALDITPAMLNVLKMRNDKINAFIGLAEDIRNSIFYNQKYAKIPLSFDVVYSILTLHHCSEPGKVFQSIREVLNPDGIAIIVDLYKHSFYEFREEMMDIHLGFDLNELEEYIDKKFSKCEYEVLPGIKCECSKRSAEIFIATLHP